MTALAGLPLIAASTPTPGEKPVPIRRSKKLVAYFSRSGNTRVVAGLIQRSHDTNLFEIVPAKPYPEDYLETVEQARRERDSGFEPALVAKVTDLTSYSVIYLGFPIWGETAPPVIRSFLSTHDLSGKTLIPFVTHGGFGLGNSQSVLSQHAPSAKVQKPFSMKADQERKTMDEVNAWLGGHAL